ncbi:hypothetical protein RclHR1_06400011 [Rhizophagus clarus]|uniref:BTB domain-containing protein n=1 Tax=Rhizophagus clarus TaxID=94130 RepID=A0A2Z6RU49_9GLOM|nr:hypothetical protein RclHR1_06400011 [Rhizophagus clarus]GES97609.1 hypothetical protein GLOIN_2v435946 [Rhizophagus clarus]
MMRGRSLKQDFRSLINNQKYSDVEILCGDEKKFYCSKIILAARSEIFDGLFYNGLKETYENQISFPNINSLVMKIVLEYIYTGSIEEETLKKDNVFEVFNVADYFQLPGLQDLIVEGFKNTLENNHRKIYSPEFLTRAVDIMQLSDDNVLLNFLVEKVATIPLNAIEFGRLSIKALQRLLSYAHGRNMSLATSEYEVFRYSVILVAKQISDNTYKNILKRLPTLEQIEKADDSVQINTVDHQEITKELEPLIKYIDFSRIKGQILANVIEPLEIVSDKTILNAYRKKARSNFLEKDESRSIPQLQFLKEFSDNYVWDESGCGSELVIMENGRIVKPSFGFSRLQSVRAKKLLEFNKGTFEWDVIIEKSCRTAYVGVCASENFNYEAWAGNQPTGWVIGSTGCCYNSGKWGKYCEPFFDTNDVKITVHIDMNRRTLAFTVNGKKYPEMRHDLPPKLYPVASLKHPGRFRIKSH